MIVPAAPTEEEEKKSEEAPEIQYEYRELDDELKQEIRDTIQRERTEERIDEMLTKAASFMKSLERERGREHLQRSKQIRKSSMFVLKDTKPPSRNFANHCFR